MKKILLSIAIIAATVSLVGCSSKNKWTREERRQMREELKNYRDMVYVQNLNDSEFEVFSDDVADAIEVDYPVYTTFIEMPGSGDTVEVYVVSTIVNQLDADAHNMRNIYPYPYLVAQGVLPANLSRDAQRAFYKCFAEKVDNYYPSTVLQCHSGRHDQLLANGTLPAAVCGRSVRLDGRNRRDYRYRVA